MEIRIMYLLLLTLALPVHSAEPEPKVIYKQKTEIDFEGVEIQGELVKPQGSLLLERKRAQFNSMVWIRPDFDDEMDKSVEEVK
jgi:hypothetical protein